MWDMRAEASSVSLIGSTYFDGLVVCRAEATEIAAAERICLGEMKLIVEYFHKKEVVKEAE